ncbi:hypothetical protein DV736_g6710, partial [Chaetothyriales sp. CBS 134916]
MKTFRILCALIASADLEAEQWDVVGAFLNSDIPDGDEIYVGFPEGFKKQGLVLRLRRGLYGLRQSPKLWFDTWAAILDKFGLVKADEEACLWMNDWLILFFYVDDVISAFNNRDRPLYEDLMTNMRKEIEIQELGELKWFLGMRVVRYRPQRRLWISQASYIEKIATRAAVDWKSAKQTSVSTSSTEAELRALEYGAKSLIHTYRLFKSIQFDPEQDLEVNCDNRQTIRLVESENPTLVTALRHVDVAHHWVREQVQQGTLRINWVSSAEQSADGLTKALPGQKHRIFLQQLGLVPLPKDQD